MQYRKGAGGQDWSALGFGCMRFSRSGAGIDQDEAEREILRAVELGVNYFDTAYIYPGDDRHQAAAVSDLLDGRHREILPGAAAPPAHGLDRSVPDAYADGRGRLE